MKLTQEQSNIVEKNHNLIYGYAHSRNLDIEEWYGDLAIALCDAVISYDPNKGALSTYYYSLSDNMVSSVIRANNALKRQPDDILSLDYDYAGEDGHFTLHDTIIPTSQESVEDTFFTNEKFKDIFEGPYGNIVDKRSRGYTQEEIARSLGFSQQYISEVLREIREELEDDLH